MKYTVILYSLPAGGAQTVKTEAVGPNEAAAEAIKLAELESPEVEIIAVIEGHSTFVAVNEKQFALFPYAGFDIEPETA